MMKDTMADDLLDLQGRMFAAIEAADVSRVVQIEIGDAFRIIGAINLALHYLAQFKTAKRQEDA